MEQIRNPERQLQNALQCVEFLQQGFSTRATSSYAGRSSRDIHRTFWHVGEHKVNRYPSMACNTIAGSRSLHSIMGNSITNKTVLLVRQLSCFCRACIEKDWENCEQHAHVTRWRAVQLQPKTPTEELDPIEDDPMEQVIMIYVYVHFCN